MYRRGDLAVFRGAAGELNLLGRRLSRAIGALVGYLRFQWSNHALNVRRSLCTSCSALMHGKTCYTDGPYGYRQVRQKVGMNVRLCAIPKLVNGQACDELQTATTTDAGLGPACGSNQWYKIGLDMGAVVRRQESSREYHRRLTRLRSHLECLVGSPSGVL